MLYWVHMHYRRLHACSEFMLIHVRHKNAHAYACSGFTHMQHTSAYVYMAWMHTSAGMDGFTCAFACTMRMPAVHSCSHTCLRPSTVAAMLNPACRLSMHAGCSMIWNPHVPACNSAMPMCELWDCCHICACPCLVSMLFSVVSARLLLRTLATTDTIS